MSLPPGDAAMIQRLQGTAPRATIAAPNRVQRALESRPSQTRPAPHSAPRPQRSAPSVPPIGKATARTTVQRALEDEEAQPERRSENFEGVSSSSGGANLPVGELLERDKAGLGVLPSDGQSSSAKKAAKKSAKDDDDDGGCSEPENKPPDTRDLDELARAILPRIKRMLVVERERRTSR